MAEEIMMPSPFRKAVLSTQRWRGRFKMAKNHWGVITCKSGRMAGRISKKVVYNNPDRVRYCCEAGEGNFK
jgi:hypothetical protein